MGVKGSSHLNKNKTKTSRLTFVVVFVLGDMVLLFKALRYHYLSVFCHHFYTVEVNERIRSWLIRVTHRLWIFLLRTIFDQEIRKSIRIVD